MVSVEAGRFYQQLRQNSSLFVDSGPENGNSAHFRAAAAATGSQEAFLGLMYCPRVLGQWFDGIRFYAAASSPTRSRRTWAGLR